MGVSLAQLDQRDIARLRAELCEVIAARFAWPAFYDYRTGTLRARPLGAARRQEINAFVRAAILEPVEQVDLSGPEMRRYLEALFQRYLEVNHDLARGAARRRLSLLRVDVPRAAAEVQRGLVALAAGTPGDFGAPRPVAAWSDPPAKGRHEPSPEAIQRGADEFRAALMAHTELPAAPAAATTAAHMPAAVASQPPQPAPSGQGAWARMPMERTAPLPAINTPAGPGGSGGSPFAGLEGGSQSALFGMSAAVAPSEQPTGQLPVAGLSGVMPGRSDAGRALSPDLLQMYGDYLRDMQPETGAPAGRGATGAHPVPSARPPAPAGPLGPPSAERTRTDAQIFAQLRFQIEAYIRLAARSYNVRPAGSDPASALDALRRSGHVDEADLRIAEQILALADRVVASGGGTMEDYRQALLLYLLYHRGRLGA
jgi:hypothetical protein